MQKYQIKRVLGYREFIQISKFQIDDFIYALYLHIYKRTKMNVMKSLASLLIYQNKENFVDFLHLFSFVNTLIHLLSLNHTISVMCLNTWQILNQRHASRQKFM